MKTHKFLQFMVITLIALVLGNMTGCTYAQSTDDQSAAKQEVKKEKKSKKDKKTKQKGTTVKKTETPKENNVANSGKTTKTKAKQAPDLGKILELKDKIRDCKNFFEEEDLRDDLANLMGNYDNSPVDYPDLKLYSDADENYDTKGIKISFFVPIRLYGKVQDPKLCTNLFLDYSSGVDGRAYTLIHDSFFIQGPWGENQKQFFVNEIQGTTVTFYLLTSDERMKELVKKKENYKIQISIENLSYESPKTWGKYRYTYLRDNNSDCFTLLEQGDSSNYYVEEEINTDHQPDKILMADLKTIKILNKETNEIVETIPIKNAEFPRAKENPERELSENEKIINGKVTPVKEYDLTNAKELLTTLSSIAGKKIEYIHEWTNYLDGLEREYEYADAFDKKDIRKKIDQAKEAVSEDQEIFLIESIRSASFEDYGYHISNYKSEGIKLIASVSMHFIRDTSIKTKENISTLSLEETMFGSDPSYMLTKDGKLQGLRNTGISGFEILAHGGVVYCPEDFTHSSLLIDIIAPKEIIKDIYKNQDNYEAVIVFNNFKYDHVSTLGFLRYDYLRFLNFDYPSVRQITLKGLKLDNKDQPAYFITDIDNPKENKRLGKAITANLRCVEIRNKTTKEVVAKITYE